MANGISQNNLSYNRRNDAAIIIILSHCSLAMIGGAQGGIIKRRVLYNAESL